MRKTRLTRKSSLRAPPLGRKGRKPSERDRIYGPKAFRDWLHQQPCVVTGRYGVVQAHVKNGGMARKADYEWSVPMLDALHRELHQHGIDTFQAKYDIDLELAAIATQQQWLAHLGRLR